MNERIAAASPEELKKGYTYHHEEGAYNCLFCAARYMEGDIYPIGERLVTAEKAMAIHMDQVHGSSFSVLIEEDKKHTGLSDTQRELMTCFYQGLDDKAIAAKMNLSPSTVRYQRHHLREKAKQARIFLSLSQMMEEAMKLRNVDDIPVIHQGATMVDDRYMVTKSEADAIEAASFSSLSPLRLAQLSSKEKKKLVVLRRIAEEFAPGVRYSGKEMDETLKAIYHDYATLRRYLIEYGFMERTDDGREYWRKD